MGSAARTAPGRWRRRERRRPQEEGSPSVQGITGAEHPATQAGHGFGAASLQFERGAHAQRIMGARPEIRACSATHASKRSAGGLISYGFRCAPLSARTLPGAPPPRMFPPRRTTRCFAQAVQARVQAAGAGAAPCTPLRAPTPRQRPHLFASASGGVSVLQLLEKMKITRCCGSRQDQPAKIGGARWRFAGAGALPHIAAFTRGHPPCM